MKTVRIVVLVAVLSVAATAFLMTLLLAPPTPKSAETLPEVRRVAVNSQEFVGALSHSATFTVSAPQELKTRSVGTVTANNCVAGAPLQSHTSLYSVDGIPVIALSLETPLWRDLVLETRGDDVKALQRELIRIGYQITETGWVDWQTTVAIKQMQTHFGITASGELPLTMVQWIPAGEPLISECKLQLGSVLADNDAVVEIGEALTGVTLAATAANGVAPDGQERIAVVGEVSVPYQSGVTITDPAYLAAVQQTNKFRVWLEEKGATEVELSTQLATPITGYALPPSAIAVSGETACVYTSETETVTVTVVGSELGTSLVTSDKPLTEVLAPVNTRSCA